MAVDTNQVAQNSSTPAPTNPAAGNNDSTAVTMSGATPTATPVVARKGFRLALQEMLQGWQTAIPIGSTMTSGGGTLEQSAVVGQLQAYLGVFTTLDAQTTSLNETRAQLEAQQVEARQYYDGLKLAVASYFGAKSPQLAQFGFAPKKARKALTSTQLAVKAAKAQATRVDDLEQDALVKLIELRDSAEGCLKIRAPLAELAKMLVERPARILRREKKHLSLKKQFVPVASNQEQSALLGEMLEIASNLPRGGARTLLAQAEHVAGQGPELPEALGLDDASAHMRLVRAQAALMRKIQGDEEDNG